MRRWYLIGLALLSMTATAQERIELLPFGDFETWTVRYIKESAIIGGKTKALYMIAETDTVYGNQAFTPSAASPWGSGNAHARAFGVDKASVSVRPEKRGKGWCCRMESALETVKAAGLNLKVLATGSIYTGRLADPVGIQHSSDPNSAIDMGIPFTGRPKALLLDIKANIHENKSIVFANACAKVKTLKGHDEAQVVLILQHRWEENGHVYAYRVGTATEHFSKSTNGWLNDHRIPVRYGDITGRADYKPWEALSNNRQKTKNSAGKMVCIEEVGWRDDVAPTHMIIQIAAGCQKPFTGCPGNVVWCDNIRLVY